MHDLNPGETKLEVKGLTRRGEFHDISFSVRSGEIFGIAGLMGAGRSEVVETIFGYRKADDGLIELDGQAIKLGNPSDAIQQGLGFVSEDRKTKGLITDFSIKDNLNLVNLKTISSSGWVQSSKEKRLHDELVQKLGVRALG